MCRICKKTFHDKANLNRHVKNVHEKENQWRMSCIVPSCDLSFFHVDDLVGHLISSHEAEIEIENLNFEKLFYIQIWTSLAAAPRISVRTCVTDLRNLGGPLELGGDRANEDFLAGRRVDCWRAWSGPEFTG